MNPLLQRAHQEGTPLIDGETVTFVWQDERPPYLLGDFNQWDPAKAHPMVEVEPGLWSYQETVPRHAFIEYAYIVDLDKADTNDGRAPDPFNPRAKWNGISADNHYFYMPEATVTPLVKRQRGVARGLLSRHRIKTEGLAVEPERQVILYQPPVTEAVPLLVVYDGRDYWKQAQLPTIVDNLIAQKRIRPIALALVANGRKARFLEYGCSDVTVAFLEYVILPLARSHLNLIDIQAQPGSYGILGASMGGLMALYTGWRKPHIFGKVLSQSGAFSIFGHDFVLFDLVQAAQIPPPLKIWMDIGSYDFLLEGNQRMARALRRKGADMTYQEYPGGHNYYAWRDDLAAGLEKLFAVE
jgi:enterochelin esterase-like enzyme